MDKKVELQVINITNSQAQVGAFAMLLGEVDGERQLPIIIGPAEAQATALYLKGVKTPRPLTHDLFITSLTTGSQPDTCINLQSKGWYFLLLYLPQKRRRNYTYRRTDFRRSCPGSACRLPDSYL